MVLQAYADSFWGKELDSTAGYDALVKRNSDNKKMCQEMEDYMKKRAKLEYDFSKSLTNLAKCFKDKIQIGQLESALIQFKQELEAVANSHRGAGDSFSKHAESMKTFREEQTASAKQVVDSLHKVQETKLDDLKRTKQLEKTYQKKCRDRDTAQNESKREGIPAKELDKVKTKAHKAEDDAKNASTNYQTCVITLNEVIKEWERKMEYACQIIQELDEKRVRYLREEVWMAVNIDSKMALEVDNCCERVRQKLETCDISQELQAFLTTARTGNTRPHEYKFNSYTSRDQHSDAESSTSSTESNNGDDRASQISGTLQKTSKVFSKFRK